ncbi:hypothetical protein OH459_05430 [Vibrio sp. MM46]|uniref:hypothetical protein n=1 Tax=Vibrio sp. MM46 TaxID=2998835 RepID=UPI0022CDB296|nr:hypothetical protein [Vibrio sp. MM46]MDA0122056.1 hypothetical protein [Vibrio sp. MM46]
MAKVENPVRGYVSCPVCQSASTVHQCGEGKLIATGETPKNGRNIGILYYRCPECGNSSISKRGSEFISANMVAELSDLKPLEAAPVQVSEPKIEVENETVISGVEFEFDAKSKQAVIDAAIPVFEKHGSTLMAVFGDYIEEATLVLAILGLVYASRKQLEALQRSKMEAEHGEKASTSGTA